MDPLSRISSDVCPKIQYRLHVLSPIRDGFMSTFVVIPADLLEAGMTTDPLCPLTFSGISEASTHAHGMSVTGAIFVRPRGLTT